jgi:hypothetical protein
MYKQEAVVRGTRKRARAPTHVDGTARGPCPECKTEIDNPFCETCKERRSIDIRKRAIFKDAK